MNRRISKPVTEEEDARISRTAAADPDARELTDAELDELRPAHEMLPMIFGQDNAEQLMRRRGRPASPVTKELVSVRYDRDVLEAFRAGGEGWQSRMNTALREWAAEHGML
ncbi:BrnA antitoxin family protein [Noviherbaspirillum pedocola]|jgi:uncharacterized protein (DUF4415 family)|uniref:BrnA antitoxin family protein n=1 Tax=Noviherbaspirillum pedocola TaxID=2801341 RepID=A0A934W516_9BURK|nr:BrnA antitoxin family protein [Noviherbaspirillum pedocola]MBK4739136.1 BrnA antitoxin family protein [Noviherbaspirillum pedocola]